MDAKERIAFANQIKPAERSKSDKFSWRLYLRAAKKGRERIYVSAWDGIYGRPFSPTLDGVKSGEKLHLRLLYIGQMHDGHFLGQPLREVCRTGKGHCDYSYGGAFNTANWLDVTDWFWSEYLERGRCIVWPDGTHEWAMINRNARKCKHCGKHEHRTVVTQKVIKRIDSWQGLDVAAFKEELRDFLDPPF
jgi:hypothetical protein